MYYYYFEFQNILAQACQNETNEAAKRQKGEHGIGSGVEQTKNVSAHNHYQHPHPSSDRNDKNSHKSPRGNC